MLLELDGDGPRYRQIGRAVLKAIQSGEIAPGRRVPSSRQLATELGCARNLVLQAYEQLVLEGYLRATARGGTFVAPDLRVWPVRGSDGAPKRREGPLPAPSAQGRRMLAAVRHAMPTVAAIGRSPIDFALGQFTPDGRMVRAMARAASTVMRRGQLGYGAPRGLQRLRELLAERVRLFRGVSCSPEQIIVTSGTQQSLDLCARLLLTEGDQAIVEDPGYGWARAAFTAAGAVVRNVGLDDEGMVIPVPVHRSECVRLVFVTPSRQMPVGVTMSVGRRQALLHWAGRAGSMILEDDYDGEMLYQGRPLKALAALDSSAARVIYSACFAKSLAPALRLAYLVVPEFLVSAFADIKWLADRGSSPILQQLVLRLIESGEYDRHIVRMRRRHLQRQEVLTRALMTHFGNRLRLTGGSGGNHLLVWPDQLTECNLNSLVVDCAGRGVGIYPLSLYATRPLARPGILLGYGGLEAEEIERGVREIARAFEGIASSAA